MSDEPDPTPFTPMSPPSPQVPASLPDPAEHRPVDASAVPPPPVPVGPGDPASGGWSGQAGDWAAGSDEGTGTSPVGVLAPPRPHQELGSDWSFGAKGPRTVSIPSPRRSMAVGLVVVLIAAAGAYFFLNRSKSAEGTAIALSLKQGQTYRYQLNMTFGGEVSVQGQKTPVSMQVGEVFSWQVESVDASGVATVKMTLESITGTVNGAPFPSEQLPPPYEIKVASDGRILTASNLALASGSDAGLLFPGADQITPLLPDHPVKPGDTWTKSFDQKFPFGGGTIHYVSHNQYLRDETLNGIKSAVISSSVNLPLDFTVDLDEMMQGLGTSDPSIPKGAKMVFGGDMEFTLTSWLDLAHGTMLKGAMSGDLNMTVELKGVPQGPQVPFGNIGFAGKMAIQIVQIASDSSGTSDGGSASAADRAAQSMLRNGLVAAKTLFVDKDSYLGLTPHSLHAIEPSVTFNTASKAKKGEISVRNISRDSIVLVTRSAGGQVFCIADVARVGSVYGTQDAKRASDCSGGW